MEQHYQIPTDAAHDNVWIIEWVLVIPNSAANAARENTLLLVRRTTGDARLYPGRGDKKNSGRRIKLSTTTSRTPTIQHLELSLLLGACLWKRNHCIESNSGWCESEGHLKSDTIVLIIHVVAPSRTALTLEAAGRVASVCPHDKGEKPKRRTVQGLVLNDPSRFANRPLLSQRSQLTMHFKRVAVKSDR